MKNRIFIINLLVLFALMIFLDLKADDSWFINDALLFSEGKKEQERKGAEPMC